MRDVALNSGYPVWQRLTTTDPDEAHHWLSTCHSPHLVRLLGDTTEFRVSHAIVDCGPFTIARMEHTLGARLLTEPPTHVCVNEVIHGQYRIGYRQDVGLGPGEIVLYPAGVPLASDWEPGGLTLRIVRLPVEAVAARLGCNPSGIRYDSIQPHSSWAARHWSSLVRHITRAVVPSGQYARSALVREDAGRLLVSTLLDTFPIVSPLRVGSVWGAEAVVVRAKRFIEDHAPRSIGIPEIAAAARVSPEWLEKSFRTREGTTPMRYLRSVRLDGAHQDLKRADPATETVASIAARWGFGHPGRFARAYCARYRCPPSVTLRT